MKIKQGFSLRDVCGEKVIVPEGMDNIDFDKIIGINESGTLLWEKLQNTDSFTIDNMVEILRDEYEVSVEMARKDCESLAKQWKEIGLVEE